MWIFFLTIEITESLAQRLDLPYVERLLHLLSIYSCLPAQARECHHHRSVIPGPLQHGEGAADLWTAGHGGVHQASGGARNAAFLPRAGLLLHQGQSSVSEEEEEEKRLQITHWWQCWIQFKNLSLGGGGQFKRSMEVALKATPVTVLKDTAAKHKPEKHKIYPWVMSD